jgi:glycosyltransferase involved in cell wall biosynthesis
LSIRYICETQQGTSFARNCGLLAAASEIVCFTDDDVAPDPPWLATLLAAFADPSVGCAGGPMFLDYQGQEPPQYLHGELQGLLGGFALPHQAPVEVSTWTEFPWGGNMAFRRSVFAETGLFRVDLGPAGGRRLTAEETELISRVHKQGWKVLYLPQASVRHLVPPERLQKEHLYYVGTGFAATHVVLTADSRPGRVVRWFASDLWYAARMSMHLAGALLRRKPLWYDDYMKFWMVAKRIPLRLEMLFSRDGSSAPR